MTTAPHMTMTAEVQDRLPQGGWASPEAEARFLTWFAELTERCKGTRWELDANWWEAGVLIHTEVPATLTLAEAYQVMRHGSKLLTGPGNVVGMAHLVVPWAD